VREYEYEFTDSAWDKYWRMYFKTVAPASKILQENNEKEK
jgi:hypothetical protein